METETDIDGDRHRHQHRVSDRDTKIRRQMMKTDQQHRTLMTVDLLTQCAACWTEILDCCPVSQTDRQTTSHHHMRWDRQTDRQTSSHQQMRWDRQTDRHPHTITCDETDRLTDILTPSHAIITHNTCLSQRQTSPVLTVILLIMYNVVRGKEKHLHLFLVITLLHLVTGVSCTNDMTITVIDETK